MAYIGKQPVVGNFVKLDTITTSATATYNLLNGGVAYFPQTANNCIVSLNGVIQSPTSAYTISGSTIVFDSALTSSDSIDFILVLGDVLAIGTPSDGTITSAKLASGTAGLIAWQSIVTAATLTAVSGRGYWINTTSNACTVTLPASATAGDTIILVDYLRTWGTNAVTINTNSLKFQGNTSPNPIYNTSGQSVTLVYSGATQGWIPTVDDDVTLETPQAYTVDFLVIAGGGGGGFSGNGGNGGGGAGGYRNSYSTETSGGGGSSETSASFLPSTVYTITVGGGGASIENAPVSGSNSSISGSGFSTITSSGGGNGGGGSVLASNGGSGGGGGEGGGSVPTAGTGTANQGFGGGAGSGAPGNYGGGGGGASAVGVVGSSTGNGGDGLASSITGSSVTRGGGGGSSGNSRANGTGGSGGGGNGGSGSPFNSAHTPSTAGTANTGGGGGGSWNGNSQSGKNGGSGVVILRMPTANYSGTTTGSPTVATDGSDTILTYNASGTYTG